MGAPVLPAIAECRRHHGRRDACDSSARARRRLWLSSHAKTVIKTDGNHTATRRRLDALRAGEVMNLSLRRDRRDGMRP